MRQRVKKNVPNILGSIYSISSKSSERPGPAHRTIVAHILSMAFDVSYSRYLASEYSSSSNSVVEKDLASPASPGSSETDEETPGTLEASAVARPFAYPCTELHPPYLCDSGKEFCRRAGGQRSVCSEGQACHPYVGPVLKRGKRG